MKQFLFEMLKQHKPTAIISTLTAEYRDLSWIQVIFVKNNKYYVTTSYATSTWIGPSPAGPTIEAEWGQLLYVNMNCLEDVATVQEYSTLIEALNTEEPTRERLKGLYTFLELRSRVYVEKFLGEYLEHLHNVRFVFVPEPLLILSFASPAAKSTLSNRAGFIGSIAFTMRGRATVITRGSLMIDDICVKMNTVSLQALQESDVYEELISGQ